MEHRRVGPDENGNGVFQFRPLLRQRGGLRFGSRQLRFRARDVQVTANPALEPAANEPHLLFAQPHGPRHGGDFGVQCSHRKIILGNVGLEREQHIVERGQRCLGVGSRAFETAPNPAPKVNFVTEIQRDTERAGGKIAEIGLLVG